jgi:hypothetical protein
VTSRSPLSPHSPRPSRFRSLSVALWLGLLLALSLCLPFQAAAQINVNLSLPRSSYLLDETLTATLSIQNLAGREIVLEDNSRDGPWCILQIKAVRGDYIPSRKPGLTFPPLTLPAGQTVSRSIDLVELYALNEPGQYRIRACVNFAPTQRQYWSEPALVTTDTGKLLWNQTVGVPEGRPNAGAYRTFSLFLHQRHEGSFLYAKLEGKEEGIRYPSYPLGRILTAMAPQHQIDDANNLNVFHALSDSSYMLSQIDVATGKLGQAPYRSSMPPRQGRPSLRRTASGALGIAGGLRVSPEEIADEKAPSKARLSERPPGF